MRGHMSRCTVTCHDARSHERKVQVVQPHCAVEICRHNFSNWVETTNYAEQRYLLVHTNNDDGTFKHWTLHQEASGNTSATFTVPL